MTNQNLYHMDDIFISYRRNGGREIARTIELALKGLGYSNVFFDYNSLRDGVFNEKIIAAIQNCKDFILVLSDGAMDRCANQDDWVAKEIRTALSAGCQIIPVKVNQGNWNWPDDFPEDMATIKSIQFTTLLTDEYFDTSILRLAERLATKRSCTSAAPGMISRNNPFIDTCLKNIGEGKYEFEYVFRDCNFSITIQPLIDFVLHFCRCRNTPEELSATLQNLQLIEDEDFTNSLAIFKARTFNDIFGNPRFMLSVDDMYAVKVSCKEGWGNEGETVTQQMFEGLRDYALTKDICASCLQKMISDPFSVSTKSHDKERTDKYVAAYKDTLEKAFNVGMYRLVFKPNQKYIVKDGKVCYLGFSDMYSRQYWIREGEYDNYDDDNDPVIARYGSAEELLKDGWELD